MARDKRGLGGAGSVVGAMFIGVAGLIVLGSVFVCEKLFECVVIEDRLGDDIALGCPVAKVLQAAAFTAEREVGVGGGIDGLAADGAVVLHGHPCMLRALQEPLLEPAT